MSLKLDRVQHVVLAALRDGRPTTLWPMMRRAFLRAGYLLPDGPRTEPADRPHARIPVRAYAVTAAGRDACVEYEERARRIDGIPHLPPKILFGGDIS